MHRRAADLKACRSAGKGLSRPSLAARIRRFSRLLATGLAMVNSASPSRAAIHSRMPSAMSCRCSGHLPHRAVVLHPFPRLRVLADVGNSTPSSVSHVLLRERADFAEPSPRVEADTEEPPLLLVPDVAEQRGELLPCQHLRARSRRRAGASPARMGWRPAARHPPPISKGAQHAPELLQGGVFSRSSVSRSALKRRACSSRDGTTGQAAGEPLKAAKGYGLRSASAATAPGAPPERHKAGQRVALRRPAPRPVGAARRCPR